MKRVCSRYLIQIALVSLLSFALAIAATGSAQATTHTPLKLRNIWNLHAQGNQLVNGSGQAIRLLGVNRSGAEYMCVSNSGIFDGPVDAAAVDAMARWNIQAVRIPLNEDCWLGINGVNPAYAGLNYQKAIIKYTLLLNSRGIIPILDLHWAAPGTEVAIGQRAMANADHSPTFWKSVASVFKYNTSVVFDLYNEPYVNTWECWRDGSTAPATAPCEDVNFAVAGMQSLVNAVRSTGAKNAIMLSGIGYANWIGYITDVLPTDPLNNLIASVHIYNFSGCNSAECYQEFFTPVAAKIPVVIGELGQNDCKHDFVDLTMDWADQNGVGYIGWAWNTYDCSSFPSLVSDYNGTPTEFGVGFKNRFATLKG